MYSDNDKLLNIDGWSQQDRLRSLSTSKYSILLAFVTSLILSIVPWIYLSELPSWLLLVIGITGLFGLFVSVMTFYWQRQQTSLDEQNMDQLLISITFTLNGVMISIYSLLFLFLFVQYQIDQNYFKATNEHNSEFLFHFQLSGAIIQISILLSILAFGYNCFVLYIVAVQQEHMRVFIHSYILFYLVFLMLMVYTAKHCLSFKDSPTVSSLVHLHYVKIAIFLALFGTIISLLIYAVNLRKWKVGYFIVGSILLCFLFICAGLHFKIYRDTKSVLHHFKTECGNELRNTPQSYVKEECYCNKYVKHRGSYSTSCPAEELGVVWEADVGKDVEEQVNHQACLNLNCCGILADTYTGWFYALSFAQVGSIIFGFGLVVSLYYISSRPPFVSYKLLTTDLLYGFFITVTIIVGIIIFLTSSYDSVPPQKQLEAVSSQPLLQGDFQACQPLSFVPKCPECKGQVRLSLFAVNARIRQLVLLSDVKQYPSAVVAQYLFGQEDKDSQAISLEGAQQEVHEAYKQFVQICPIDVSQPVNLVYDLYDKHSLQSQSLTMKVGGDVGVEDMAHMAANAKPATNGKGQTTDSTTTTTKIAASVKLSDLTQIPFSNVEVEAVDAFKLKDLDNIEVQLVDNYLQNYKHLNVPQSKQEYDAIWFQRDTVQRAVQLVHAEDQERAVLLVPVGDRGQRRHEAAAGQDAAHPEAGPLQPVRGPAQLGQPRRPARPLLHLQAVLQGRVHLRHALRHLRHHALPAQADRPVHPLRWPPAQGLPHLRPVLPSDPGSPGPQRPSLKWHPAQRHRPQLHQQHPLLRCITNSNLKLQLYAYGSDKPVFETDTPIFAKGQEQHEPNLTWLALCLDGKKGLDSLDSPSEFWNYADPQQKAQWFQRNNADQRALPTAQICENFYQN